MKKRLMLRSATLGAFACLSLMAGACGTGQSSGDTITLKVADSLPTEHVFSRDGIVPWMEAVEQETDGKVQFEHYPAEQLAGADELLGATADGLTDIGYVVPSYFSDALPLSDIGALPGLYQSSVDATIPYWNLVSEDLISEFHQQDVQPVMATVAPLYQPMISGGSIEQVSDLEGKKLRSPGAVQDLAIKALGASPVSMPASDVFTSMERGTVDGTVLPLASIDGYGIADQLEGVTANAPLGGTMPIMAMNKSTWDDLPSDVQEAFMNVAEDSGESAARAWSEESQAEVEKLRDAGVQVKELSDSEIAEWTEVLAGVTDEWVAAREQDGHPAEKTLETWKRRLEEGTQ